ncbi:uncharacterized protein LOC119110749 [Pollicipes pollicipes]|uniref:uncharacterized protein LOC119110749 n=1 Tax=Pollicipes pollicipes TaxID=41117 RepID=UPI001884E75A|nr:uncharacterized protein LOC119110749 [Pollicipes pollicipes]
MQSGYHGRALTSAAGELAGVLAALEAATGVLWPPGPGCQTGCGTAQPWRTTASDAGRTGSLRLADEAPPDSVDTVRRSGRLSRSPPGVDPVHTTLTPAGDRSVARRRRSEGGPVVEAMQVVVSALVPVVFVLPWVIVFLFPDLLPLGDGSQDEDPFPVNPNDFDFDEPKRRRGLRGIDGR